MEPAGTAGPIFRPRCTRRLEELVRTPDVGIDERVGATDRAVNVRLGSEMDDGIDSFALYDVAHGVPVPDVPLHESEPLVVRQRLEIREISRVGERVQTDDGIGRMIFGPEVDEVGADESRGTRYEYPTHCKHRLRSSRLCAVGC